MYNIRYRILTPHIPLAIMLVLVTGNKKMESKWPVANDFFCSLSLKLKKKKKNVKPLKIRILSYNVIFHTVPEAGR